jgi:predicted ATPase
VNGFRSLQDFSLDLRPGLNVLVGPNGAGKSNILRFFEFVSFLSTGTLAEAVSRSGGAGEIFYRLASDKISQSITFSLMGNQLWEYEADDASAEDDNGNVSYLITYHINGVIRISDDFTSIYYENQRVKFDYRVSGDLPDNYVCPSEWKFDFESSAESEGQYSTIAHRIPADGRIIDTDFNAVTKSEMMRATRERLLTDIVSYSVFPLTQIDEDFSSGQPYNINPAKVREAEDIAQAPFIRSDGRGVASTLFSLRNAEQEPIGRHSI